MKEKFSLQTRKGQTVYRINVNIRTEDTMDNKTSLDKHGCFVQELKIVHQTNYRIVLSDPFVTVLDRKKENQRKESYNHFIDDVSICIKTKETYWPNGIFSTMYSLENPEKCISKMKSKIKTQINKEYGFLRFVDIESVIEGMEITKI